MVDVTLLEVNLEDAEFTANAPFSGKESSSKGESKVSKMLKRGRSGSDDTASDEGDHASEDGVEVEIEDGDEDESSPSLAPLLVLGVIAVLFAVLRKRRRGRGAGDQQELAEYEA